MSTLLILGSKPGPILPSRDAFDALACANASGASAAHHGLPDPAFTVMSAILTSGKEASNELALKALAGMRTGTVYLVPRPAHGASRLGRAISRLKLFRTSRPYFRRRLKASGYRWRHFVALDRASFRRLFVELCGNDPEIAALLDCKMPSMGIAALAIGLAQSKYSCFILSGFSFEITHAYADNPDVRKRGTTVSKHAQTDIAVLRCLSRRFGNVWTSEPIVAERAGIPLLGSVSPAPEADRSAARPPGGACLSWR